MSFNESDVGRAVVDLIRSELRRLSFCAPARVESFDYTHQKATVTPLLKRADLQGNQYGFTPIPDVPVVFPAALNASVTFPLVAGDTVLLVFAERTLENWIETGAEAATDTVRMLETEDAIAIAGLFPNSHTSDAEADTLKIKYKNQTIKIKSDGSIEIGGTGIKSLLTSSYKTAVDAQLGLIATSLNTLGQPVTPFVAPLDSLTSKVKAQ